MTSILPRPRLIDADDTVFDAAGVEKQPVPAKAVPAPSAAGWDPYEVWRTRVFAAQGASYKKDRGNT